MHSRMRPGPKPGADNDSVDTDEPAADEDDADEDDGDEYDPDDERFPAPDNSSHTRAAAAGRMSSRCVYSSSCVANQSASCKGRHAATTETALRKRNTDFGERLIIASYRADPHVIALTSMRARGHRPAVLSGGYSHPKGLHNVPRSPRIFLGGRLYLAGDFPYPPGSQTQLPRLPFTRSLSQPSSRVFPDCGTAALHAQSEDQRLRLLTEAPASAGPGVGDQWSGFRGQGSEC